MKPKIQAPGAAAGTKRVPTAPPVYRPQPVPHVLQPKASRVAQLKSQSGRALAAPPCYTNTNRHTTAGVRHTSTRPSAPPFASTARTVQLANNGQPPPQQQPLSEAERQAARKQRFAPELEQAEKERQAKQAVVDGLKQDVRQFEEDLTAGHVRFVNGPLARKHGYGDPIAEFRKEFRRARWEDMQAQHTDRGFAITIRMNQDETVVGSYSNGILTIVHCGEVQRGVGYGVALG